MQPFQITAWTKLATNTIDSHFGSTDVSERFLKETEKIRITGGVIGESARDV